MQRVNFTLALLGTAALSTTVLSTSVLANEELKIVDEPLELTIHMHWPRAQGYNEEYPVEIKAREMTNIHLIEATMGKNTTESEEAMNLLLAAGDMPDIVGGHLIKQPVNEFGPQGAFLPLNELVAEHAPNIQAFWDSHPGLQEAISAYDGNYYYIPYLPDGKYGRAWFIRQDWLDALELDQPQNVD